MSYEEVATVAIKLAGEYCKNNFGLKHSVSLKNNQEIVTKIDQKSEQIIKEKILQAFPTHSFLGEESSIESKQSPYTWIVDPLDGTINYTRNIPRFGISVALAKNSKVILGLVYNPLTKELFTANKDQGAFLNGSKLQVSSRTITDSFIYLTRKALMKKQFNLATNKLPLTTIITSTAYDICHIAAGKMDGAYKFTSHPWGFAAACLIVEEAGGKVTDIRGKPWNIHTTELVISNKKIHKAMIDTIS
jgi:myo-inositol-1(or 4)-monophosphatase